MNVELMVKRLVEVASRWTEGMTVWHRADGARGVVVQYVICGDGRVMIEVSFGTNQSLDRCLPLELSAVKVGDGTEGDEWRDVEGTKQ